MTSTTAYDTNWSTDGKNTNFGFVNSDSKTDNFRIKPSPPIDTQQTLVISGYKYYDTNTSGTKDSGELGIKGWQIDVTVSNLPAGLAFNPAGNIIVGSGDASHTFVTTTSNDGSYGVALSLPVGYSGNGVAFTSHEEFLNSSWIQTGPLPGATAANPPDSNATANANRAWVGSFSPQTNTGEVDASALNFGNVNLGQGGGLTLGFWSNKNGQKALTGTTTGSTLSVAAQSALDGLNLADANGPLAKPGGHYFGGSYAAFNSWLLKANATNMAYMLSVQMAVMDLNTTIKVNGSIPVDPNALVYAPGTNSANANGFAKISDLIAEASIEVGKHPLTTTTSSDSAYRAYQQSLKNAFDNANNNLTFVQGPITVVIFP